VSQIETNFHKKCGKRMTDIFTKARKKNKKTRVDEPNRMGLSYCSLGGRRFQEAL
jgi:hypothetical protein